MSIPFAMVNSMQSGGTSQTGALTVKVTAGAGSSDAGTNSAFAGTLVQALLGQNGSGVPMQPNMVASDLLAGLTASQTAEGETALPGDLLLQWLGTLDGETALEGQEELLAGLMALLELAQAVIQQWKPTEQIQNVDSSQGDTMLLGDSGATLLDSQPKSWMHTLESLVDLMKQNPDQPELAHVVQAFERLIAPVVQSATGQETIKATDSQIQMQSSSAVAMTGAVQIAGQGAAVQHNRPKQPETASEGANVKLAATTNLLMRGAEVKSRLEEIAARAGVQTQFDAIVSRSESSVEQSAVETNPIAEDGSEHGSVQLNHLVRQTSGHQQPVQQPAPIVNAERFAEEMAQVLRSMKVTGANGLSEVRITLMPEHLGQVDVKVSMQNGHIVAQFMADTVHGKEMLESQLSQLRNVLLTQGLQVERLEVAQTNPQYPGLFQDSRGQQQSQQFDRRGKEKSDEQDPIDFIAELESVADRKSQSGDGSFDVTA